MPTLKSCPSVPRCRSVHALTLGLVTTLAASACSPSADDGDPAASDDTATDPVECTTRVETDDFASAEELRDLTAEFNDFGMRSPGSDQHEASKKTAPWPS